MSEHYGSYPGQQYAPPPPPVQQNGLGTAGMVLGIIALVLFWTIFVGVVCGVLAIIFGAIGRRRARDGVASNHGSATAGLATGIIAVIISLLFAAIVIPNHYCFHAGNGPDPCVQQ